MAPVYPLEKEKELFYALKCGNESTCHRIIDEILEEWQVSEGFPEPLTMIRLLSGLAFAIYRAFCDEITAEERLRLEADLTVLEAMRSLTFEGWRDASSILAVWVVRLWTKNDSPMSNRRLAKHRNISV